ncbi:hypothetical protein JCM10213_005670 [Rhodosporidiobolus nylandii]
MLRRQSTAPTLALPPATTPPAFPGLVSSLRPVRRIATQVSDEAQLLRRFTYKNKNQFKGTGWWRKLVEVDRTTSRASDELTAWLREFGLEGEKDETGVISREAVCAGLLRLPRAMLVVEKNIQVLLGCASILEQLIHSRAFLAFAVVVVALIARLHSLFTVLLDELSKTSGVLVKLAELNGLLDALQKPLLNLPRDLRRYLPLDSANAPLSLPVSIAPSAAPTPAAASPAPLSAQDDLGAVVARSSLSAKPAALPSPAPSAPSANPEPKKKKKRPPPSSAEPSPAPSTLPSRAASPAPAVASLFPFDLDPAPAVKPVKRAKLAPMSAGVEDAAMPTPAAKEKGEALKKPKKTKEGDGGKVKKKGSKKRKGGDEIDDIFG